jgi:hypothetical protein
MEFIVGRPTIGKVAVIVNLASLDAQIPKRDE